MGTMDLYRLKAFNLILMLILATENNTIVHLKNAKWPILRVIVVTVWPSGIFLCPRIWRPPQTPWSPGGNKLYSESPPGKKFFQKKYFCFLHFALQVNFCSFTDGEVKVGVFSYFQCMYTCYGMERGKHIRFYGPPPSRKM